MIGKYVCKHTPNICNYNYLLTYPIHVIDNYCNEGLIMITFIEMITEIHFF